MIAHAVHIGFMALAAGAGYWGWLNLNMLRGTVYFEFRYILLMAAIFLVLSLAQAIAGWITGRLFPEDH